MQCFFKKCTTLCKTYPTEFVEDFKDKNERDQKGEDLLRKPSEISNQSTALEGDHDRDDDKEPDADPGAVRKVFYTSTDTKLGKSRKGRGYSRKGL